MVAPIAEKTFTSGLPDLLTQLLGTKAVTSSPGSTQTTSSQVTANTAPLEQAIATAGQQMTPEVLQQLIAGIFGTAAQQVPQLTASLANATGSRSSNNSPLALAITDQNNLAMKQALQQMLQYNQQANATAVQGAASLANSTKNTTETISKAPSEQTVQTGTGGNPMQMALLGFLANQANKRGLFSKLGDSMFGGGEAAQLTTPQLTAPTFDFQPTAGADANFTGANTIFQAQPVFSSPAMTFDAGTGAAVTDFGINDIFSGFSGAGDLGMGAGIGDAFSGAIDAFSAVGNAAPQAFDPLWDISDMGFFADGGTVRNRNNMGAAQQRTGMAAINGSDGRSVAPVQMQAQAPRRSGANVAGAGLSSDVITTFLENVIREEQSKGDSPAMQDLSPQAVAALEADAANGYAGRSKTLSIAAGLLAGMVMPAMGVAAGPRAALNLSGVTSSPVGAGVKLVQQALSQQKADASTQTINDSAPVGANVATNPVTGGQYSELPAVDVLGNVAPADMSLAPPGVVTLDFSNAALSGIPTADGSSGVSGSGDFSGGYGQSGGGGNDAYGLADGGPVSGPGTGTSDSIRARSKTPGAADVMLSDKEFIVPADVMAQPGMLQHFQTLINAYHRPVRR